MSGSGSFSAKSCWRWKDEIFENPLTIATLQQDTVNEADLRIARRAKPTGCSNPRAHATANVDRQIDEALPGLTTGLTGIAKTGELIALSRLEARPIATLSQRHRSATSRERSTATPIDGWQLDSIKSANGSDKSSSEGFVSTCRKIHARTHSWTTVSCGALVGEAFAQNAPGAAPVPAQEGIGRNRICSVVSGENHRRRPDPDAEVHLPRDPGKPVSVWRRCRQRVCGTRIDAGNASEQSAQAVQPSGVNTAPAGGN